ncbi:hypothetical protein BV22DRAFT_670055 [Leucogyrophana mollusca]|uniref:Uncharacterized protein n=1 Tax=Leucogyrophana mollusca TaxID=85980 RepID=A0ACB8BAQ1_9AGAM|nr:hypothetical protein BV22DRAFT_670055 [Leucogyrophana mollusca]
MPFLPAFMTVIPPPQMLGVRALGDDTEDDSDKSIFQHVYFIAAIALALLLIAWRKNNRPVSEFFSLVPSYTRRPLADHQPYSSSYQPGYVTPLTPLPAAYRPDRRVRAADTDAGGRRLGAPDDGDWDAKDALPAYDNIGGPPKYAETDLRASYGDRVRFGANPELSPTSQEFPSASTSPVGHDAGVEGGHDIHSSAPEGQQQEHPGTIGGITSVPTDRHDHGPSMS